MTNQDHEQSNQPDPVDALLANAFDAALSGPGNQQLVDQVMARIARQQRQRAWLLGLLGLAAAVVLMLSALPLLGLLENLFAGFTSLQAEPSTSLPVTAVALAILGAGAWLLFEEATA